jgi:putative DNA methylase
MANRTKLIEVALPLEAINVASAREKSIRHGHPSTLHLWWARRPLAAARAVIFSSLVDDPDSPDALPAFVEACRALPIGPNAKVTDTPRMRLFDFIERLVTWEATTDEKILNTARELILIATEGNPPPLLDPFAGGGSIPLEAQRLGLEAHASDLNPVAVMINKAQIEIPPRFANQPPTNPRDRQQMFGGSSAKAVKGKKNRSPADATWRGAAGLAADVRYYGEWMRAKAWEKIGHLYPTHNGETVIAWIWARTVKSPNPAVDAHVPLVRSFELSKKKGKRAWIEPTYDARARRVVFTVRREQDGDDPKSIQDGTVNRRGGRCIASDVAMPLDYIRAEGKADRMGAQLMAIVTDGKGGRNYYSPDEMHVEVAQSTMPEWVPDAVLPINPRDFKTPNYGMRTFSDLFTPRQLVALTTFSDLVAEARAQAHQDALTAGLAADDVPLRDGGRGARAYSEAVSVYLAFAVDRLAERGCSVASWQNSADKVRGVFSRQAIPMVWDYAEANAFSASSGNFGDNVEWVAEATESINFPDNAAIHRNNSAMQIDAAVAISDRQSQVISTDPPYYDNIGYADLSDFFYIWMRRPLREVYPDVFGTLLVPKEPELIASPYRHGGSKEAANQHFEGGMLQAFGNMRRFVDGGYPLTVYYAFKQQDTEDADDSPAESDDDDDVQVTRRGAPAQATASTGWETMLNAMIQSGFSINGTWPMRTERGARTIGIGTNALASSIILVCRPRSDDAPTISRRQFVDALRRELPNALKAMQTGSIAPVDLAQASIGPGMAIYSRYSTVLEADGSALSVRAALGLINQELDAYLAEQDGDIDVDTRFAVAWFSQFGFSEGEFGVADVLARAKNTSVAGVVQSGLAVAGRGKVRLTHWKEIDPGTWNPQQDRRPTVWEAVHHLIERLNAHGEQGAASLLLQMNPEMAAEARNLAYRLYNICERKGWSEHALEYNKLAVMWTAVADRAAEIRAEASRGDDVRQLDMFE